jgi:DNA-binding NarL/FixJ family response regulator
MSHMPTLLRDLLSEMLDAEDDIAVVTALREDDELADAVWRTHADVLIVQLAELSEQAACAALLSRLPHLKVVALSQTATGATMYELRPARGLIGEVTSARLLAVLRRSTLPMPAERVIIEAEPAAEPTAHEGGSALVGVRVAPPWEGRP